MTKTPDTPAFIPFPIADYAAFISFDLFSNDIDAMGHFRSIAYDNGGARCEMTGVSLGNACVNRAGLVAMIGADEVRKIEAIVTDDRHGEENDRLSNMEDARLLARHRSEVL